MKYSRFVVTCGVSVFAEANSPRQWTEKNGIFVFPTPSPNPELPKDLDQKEALNKLDRALAVTNAIEDITKDPTRVSAEYSALHALAKEKRLAERPYVVLIHTDTLGGKAAATALNRILTEKFRAKVECVECSINVQDRNQLRYNLGDFMHKVATALKDHDKSVTCFAPLGGFKVMTSLGYLAGAFFGFPTLYTHEDNQIVHEIPPVPVNIPDEQLRKLAPLLTRIGKGLEITSLSDQERSLLKDNTWLFERADDLVCVNEFGLFLMHQRPALFGTKVFVSKEVNDEYENDSRQKFVKQQLNALCAKLVAESNEPELRHEIDWDVKPCDDWHLYKGASNGQLVMRAIYKYDREQDTLTVKYVWTSHDYVEDFKAKWNRPLGETIQWNLS